MSIPNFSITGIPPGASDFKTGYPVLAVYVKHSHIVSAQMGTSPRRAVEKSYFTINKQIYAKDGLFLIADRNRQFRWISPEKCNLFLPQLFAEFYLRDTRRLTRYSLNREIGEDKKMIIPLRPFSITGISEEGFDSGKAYPVLAIDIDQYFPEMQEDGEEEPVAEQRTESMAVFLVGNDAGEFVWIAEDECRLFPLDS